MRVTLTNKAAPAQGISAQVFSRSADTVIGGTLRFLGMWFGSQCDRGYIHVGTVGGIHIDQLAVVYRRSPWALALTVTVPVSGC